jgi:hypothetical protein
MDMTLHRKHGAGGHTSIDIPSPLTDSKFLVKPVGSLQSVFIILDYYLARDERSTVNLEYGTIDNLSNVSIFQVYAKLGPHKATIRPTGPLHVDVFPRRLDWKLLPGRGKVMANVPDVLKQFWEDHTDQYLHDTSARVIIVCGHQARKHYTKFLPKNSIRHEILRITGIQRATTELSAAWVELYDDDSIRRIALGTLAPGGFIRTRARLPISTHEYSAFRKRLIGFATTMLFGAPHLPAFLSSANYYWSLASGLNIPHQVFLDLTEENDTLSAWLHRPTSNFSSMDDMIRRFPALLTKKDLIYRIRKTQNVKPMAAPLFWDTPAMHAEYGPFTQLYRAIAERFSNANQAARDRDRARIAQLPQAKQDSRRVNINALANKRKKRCKAARQRAADEIAVNDGDEQSEEDVEAIMASTAPVHRLKRTARASRIVVESDDEASMASTAPVRRLERTTHAPRDVIVISDDE